MSLIKNSAFTQMKWDGNIGSRLQALPGQAGSINVRAIVNSLNTFGFKPKDGDAWVNDVNNGALSLDHLDLRGQYEGRVVNMDVGKRMSSAEYNSTNSFLYQKICPLFPTSEFNFGYTSMQVYMVPFDEADPMNVGRVTGYKRTMTTFTLKSYKRSQEAEIGLLSDENYGAAHLRMMRDTIDKQAELTFMWLIGLALVDFPVYARLRKLNHPVHAVAHSRQLLMETEETFMGNNQDPARLLSHVAKRVTDENMISAMIIPKGAGERLIKGQGEPQASISYRPIFDQAQQQILIEAYSDGSKTFRTVPVGNGRRLDVYELQGFKGYDDDAEAALTQPLRSVLTLGEIIRDHSDMSLSELYESGQTLSPKRLDLYCADQTPTRIHVGKVPFSKKLRNCIMFLDEFGNTLDKDDAGISPIWSKLASDYNKEAGEFYKAFREREHQSNDNAATSYLNQDTLLEQAKGWRHYDGFLCYNDGAAEEGARVEVPFYVGDVEPKTFDPNDLFAVAQMVAREEKFSDAWKVDAMVGKITEAVDNADTAITAFFAGAGKTAYDVLTDNIATLAVIKEEVKTAIQSGSSATDIRRAVTEAMASTTEADATKKGAFTKLSPVLADAILAAIETDAIQYSSIGKRTKDLQRIIAKYFPTSLVLKGLKNKSLQDQADFLVRVLGKEDFDEGQGGAGGGNALPIPGRFPINAALFAAPLGSPLVPAANESLDAYKARVTHDALSRAADDGTIGPSDSAWVKMLQHVPDVAHDHFATIAHTVLSRPLLSQDDAEGLAALSDMLEKESRSAFITHTLNGIARALPNLAADRTIGKELKARAERGWLSQTAQTTARAAATPSAILANLVESHLENAMRVDSLGSAATIVGADDDIATFRTRVEGRYSWQTYQALIKEKEASVSDAVLVFYVALLQSRFNYRTFASLLPLGINLFQIPGLRMFIYQSADMIVLTATGPDIMRLAVGHGLVTSGINAQQATYTMHASVHAGVLMLRPECLDIIANAIAAEHLGGRNLEAVRTLQDMMVPNALDRRSIIFCPLPNNERRFSFPVSVTRENPYAAPDTRTQLFARKISLTDGLREFISTDVWDQFIETNTQNANYYFNPIHMATHLHDGCVWLPNNLHPDWKTLTLHEGTGPFGPGPRNQNSAVNAYAGNGVFKLDADPVDAY